MHFALGTLNQPKIFDINMTVDEVFRFRHLESVVASKHINYPETQQYYLYGDKKHAYISHIITKHEDFHQVFSMTITITTIYSIVISSTAELIYKVFGVVFKVRKLCELPITYQQQRFIYNLFLKENLMYCFSYVY